MELLKSLIQLSDGIVSRLMQKTCNLNLIYKTHESDLRWKIDKKSWVWLSKWDNLIFWGVQEEHLNYNYIKNPNEIGLKKYLAFMVVFEVVFVVVVIVAVVIMIINIPKDRLDDLEFP